MYSNFSFSNTISHTFTCDELCSLHCDSCDGPGWPSQGGYTIMGRRLNIGISIVGLVIALSAAWFIVRGPFFGGPLPPKEHIVGAAAWFVVGTMMIGWGSQRVFDIGGTERPDVDNARLRTYKR